MRMNKIHTPLVRNPRHYLRKVASHLQAKSTVYLNFIHLWYSEIKHLEFKPRYLSYQTDRGVQRLLERSLSDALHLQMNFLQQRQADIITYVSVIYMLYNAKRKVLVALVISQQLLI